jgi:uncharacterized protein YciI
MPYFVVINEQGPSWVDSRPMREQALWSEHADFVNSLVSAGFFMLGGPIGGGRPHRALLIVIGESETTARARLLEDPWVKAGILRVGVVEPWKILASNDKLDPILAELSAAGPSS